jgi:hypothetical protein
MYSWSKKFQMEIDEKHSLNKKRAHERACQTLRNRKREVFNGLSIAVEL